MKTVTRWISGAVLAACALSGFVSQAAAEPITPATVSFVEAPITLATDTTGELFPAGTVYWQADFSMSARQGFVATWERSTGVWETLADAESAVRRNYECISEKYRVWFDSFPDFDSFVRSLDPGDYEPDANGHFSFDAPQHLTFSAECRADWDWSRVKTSHNDTITTVRVPLDVIGPGDHQLFIASLGRDDRDVATDPECVYKKWDGEESAEVSLPYSCGLIFGSPAYAWVRVPEVGDDSPGMLSTSGPLPPKPLPTWAIASLIAGGAVVTVGGVLAVAIRRRRRSHELTAEPVPPTTGEGTPQGQAL